MGCVQKSLEFLTGDKNGNKRKIRKTLKGYALIYRDFEEDLKRKEHDRKVLWFLSEIYENHRRLIIKQFKFYKKAREFYIDKPSYRMVY